MTLPRQPASQGESGCINVLFAENLKFCQPELQHFQSSRKALPALPAGGHSFV
jgi:hypothetical protein